MKSMKTVFACACATLAISCAEKGETVTPAPETRTITLTANREQLTGDTRTQLEDGARVVWEKEDEIDLWYRTQTGTFSRAGHLTAIQVKGSQAVFSGECKFENEAESPEYIALYPYGPWYPRGDGEFSISNTITSDVVDKSFSSTNPATAYGNDLSNMQFKNAFGIIKFTYTTDTELSAATLALPDLDQYSDPFNGDYFYNPISGEGRIELGQAVFFPTTYILFRDASTTELNKLYTAYIPLAPMVTESRIQLTFQDPDYNDLLIKESNKPLAIKPGVITNLGHFDLKKPAGK